jgi:sugar/nucleoside kinase (ribokinase family)
LPGHAIRAVDTLAAGDVFHGVLTWALAQGTDLFDCIAISNAAAAIKCQAFGGRLGAPDRPTLHRFLEAADR